MYRYILSSTGDNSRKYGNCDVCGKFAPEVFYQSEERQYEISDFLQEELKRKIGWTHFECSSRFGHSECLRSARREPHVEMTLDEYHAMFRDLMIGRWDDD